MHVIIHQLETGRVRIVVTSEIRPQDLADLELILLGVHTRQLLDAVLKNLQESWGIEATAEDIIEPSSNG